MTSQTLTIARTPMVGRYGFLLRFIVLVAIWAKIAADYRLLMVQTPLGLATSAVFFASSILVLFGYKTRVSMVVLALSMLGHAYLFHQKASVAAGVLALFAAALPIGANYSVDRYLQTDRVVTPYRISEDLRAQPLASFWRVLLVALLAFNIGGPAYNQVFHHHVKALRSWDMFHTAARDLITLRFYRGDDRETGRVDYMRVLGHPQSKPSLKRNGALMGDMEVIGTTELDQIITRVCAAATDPAGLRLDARIVELKTGWVPLYRGENICDASGGARLKHPYPTIDEFGLGWGDEGEEM